MNSSSVISFSICSAIPAPATVAPTLGRTPGSVEAGPLVSVVVSLELLEMTGLSSLVFWVWVRLVSCWAKTLTRTPGM